MEIRARISAGCGQSLWIPGIHEGRILDVPYICNTLYLSDIQPQVYCLWRTRSWLRRITSSILGQVIFRGLPYMTSAKFSDLLTPLPLSLSQISWFWSSRLLFGDPPPTHCERHMWKPPKYEWCKFYWQHLLYHSGRCYSMDAQEVKESDDPRYGVNWVQVASLKVATYRVRIDVQSFPSHHS